MSIIHLESIAYSEAFSTGQGCNFGQDILFNNEVIGYLETRFFGLLKPHDESYQFVVEGRESELSSYAYSKSETIGWFVLFFDTIEEFIQAYNQLFK